MDILLTARYRQVSSDLSKNVKDYDIQDALNYRFLEQAGGKYRETTLIGGRARKVWEALDDATAYFQAKLLAQNECLIALSPSKMIKDWYA